MLNRIKAFCILIAFGIGLVSQAYAVSTENILDIDYNCGDKTFFNSNYIYDRGVTYDDSGKAKLGTTYGDNIKVVDNENTIKLNRCEQRYNSARTDNSIRMEKTLSTECFINVHGITYEVYPYYLVRGSVTAECVKQDVTLCLLRSKAGWNKNGLILRLLANGDLVLSDDKVVANVGIGQKFDYAVNVNIAAKTADVYVNGVYKDTSVLTDDTVNIDLIRFGINTTTIGDIVSFEDMEIVGMQKPYTGSEDNYSSAFHSDEAIEEYLFDKIAYHEYSGAVYQNGEKTYPDTMPTFDESKYKYVFKDGAGLTVLSNTDPKLSLENETSEYKQTGSVGYKKYSDVKTLNWYMAYERPSASQMKADFKKNNSGHPRILADKDDFDYIRENRETDAYLKKVCDYVIAQADAVLKQSAIEYNIADGQRILSISRKMLSRMEYLGFAYQITQDTKYAECGWKNLSKVISYPDWNPSHMIDVGEMNAAAAIGFDWMYDAFNDEQRQQIYNGAKNLGMDVTRRSYYGRVPYWVQYAQAIDGFVKWKSNFNTVINGGALASAMAFAEYDEDFCFDLAEKAVRSLEFTLIGFAPDGAWAEGLHYMDYTMSYLSNGVGSLMTTLGTDYGLMKSAGLDKSGMWFRSMMSPQGANNFHDFDMSDVYLSCRFSPWLAKVYDDDDLYAMRRAETEKSGKFTVYDGIWYQKDGATSEANLPKVVTAGGVESFSVRSSYTDDDAMYFSAHGGLVYCYHSHADAGSFIYDVDGERWAADLGAENYNTQRDGNINYYGSYRRRAEAHNVVVINPNTSDKDGGQSDDGFAELVEKKETSRTASAKYDMTSAYADYANDYSRSFYTYMTSKSVVVEDVIDLKDAAEVYWFMTTPAAVEWTDAAEDTTTDEYDIVWQSATKFSLTQNDKTVYGTVEVDGGDLSCATTDCSPLLNAPVLTGQNANKGYQRVALKVTADGSKDVTIRVTLSPDINFSHGTEKVYEANFNDGKTVGNFGNATEVSTVGGTAGKTSSDKAMRIYTDNKSGSKSVLPYVQIRNAEHMNSGVDTSRPYTAETLIRTEGDFDELKLQMGYDDGKRDLVSLYPDGTVKRDASSPTITTYNPGEWVRIGITVYPAINKYELSVNGIASAKEDGTLYRYTFDNAEDFARLRYEQSVPVGKSAAFSLDDICVYNGTKPVRTQITLTSNDYDIDNENRIIRMPEDDVDMVDFYGSISGRYEYTILEDRSLGKALGEGENVNSGNILVAYSEADGIYKYYYITAGAEAPFEIDKVTVADGTVADWSVSGEKTLKAKINCFEPIKKATMLIAEYDGETLVSVSSCELDFASVFGGEGNPIVGFPLPLESGTFKFDYKDTADSIRVYIFDGLSNIVPLSEVKTIEK